MLNVHRVLFPTDLTECSNHAYSHALLFASHFGAEVHVLNVAVPYDADKNDQQFDVCLDEEGNTWADSYLTEGLEQSVPIRSCQVRVVSAAMGILNYAKEHDIDVIVMGTHGRHGLDRLFIGSVAEDVVRSASCPVFTVRCPDQYVGPLKIQKILVPIDYSESALTTMKYANELAVSYGAGLHLIHVIQEAVFPTTYGVEPVAIAVPEVISRSKKALLDLRSSKINPEIPVNVHVLIGNPASDIVDFAADLDVDLVVIATHGLSGIKRLLIGSVTEKVVRMAQCPVFTVKSFGKSLITE